MGPVPIFRLVWSALETIERTVLRELKNRLDRLEPEEQRPSATETPAAVMAELLDRSLEQSPEEARGHAFLTILRELAPDEARIFAALSDGGGHPVIHVTAASTLGSSSRRVLSNVSPIGQTAGVQLREMTPHYVAHLLELGLVELAPEDPNLAVKYEILESHSDVRAAVETIARGEKMTRARIVRRTIRLTNLGRELWAACQPDND